MWLSTNRVVFSDTIGDVDSVPYCDPVSGLYVWHSILDSKYYISSQIGHSYSASGYWSALLKPSYFRAMSNYIYFSGDIGGGTFIYLFKAYDTPGYWYIGSYLDAGISEWQVGTIYYGDIFFSNGTSNFTTGAYAGGGTLKNSSPVPSVTLTVNGIDGWESSTLYGEYTPVAGSSVSGNKYVGWNRYLMDNGKGYFRQKNIKINEKYKIQSETTSSEILYWDTSSSWLFGEDDPSIGYWANSGANPEGSYSLIYTGPDPRPTPETYTVSFDSYVEGLTPGPGGAYIPELESLYLAEALRFL